MDAERKAEERKAQQVRSKNWLTQLPRFPFFLPTTCRPPIQGAYKTSEPSPDGEVDFILTGLLFLSDDHGTAVCRTVIEPAFVFQCVFYIEYKEGDPRDRNIRLALFIDDKPPCTWDMRYNLLVQPEFHPLQEAKEIYRYMVDTHVELSECTPLPTNLHGIILDYRYGPNFVLGIVNYLSYCRSLLVTPPPQ